MTQKLFIIIIAVFFSWKSWAMGYEEGVHYFELSIPVGVVKDGKIEVTEYFSYGCGHCYQFDPILAAWEMKLPEDVEFNRTPAIWNSAYRVYAQTYYTVKAMGILDKVHLEIFNAIHLQRRDIRDPKAIANLLAEVGVDPISFAKVYGSFGVQASVQQAEARGRAYRASGVPTLIVAGKYRVESGSAGGQAGMINVVDYLIEKEREMN
ncbi:MAG: thiol:disulfide interchange protein DsbA/DsbL [Pseudomonadales bacterium]|jgi:thiol:disulfide interchange protein DsbA|nr:thiol:disulfide interchange protein DsbA/DsbL [Pseudomonadales bacterium]